MQAKLIQTIDGRMIVSAVVHVDNILPAFEIRGFTFSRINAARGQRVELQGLPVFSELLGPMYDGPGFVRYEDSESNDRLSA